jgi:hypothetical protein
MATVTMGRDRYLPMAGSVAGVVAVLAAAVAPAYGGVVDGTHDAIVRVCFVGDAVAKKQEDVSFIWRHLKMFENHGHIKFVLMDNDGRCPNPRPSGDARFEANDGDLRIGVPGTLDYDGKTPITGLKLGKGCADPGTPLWWSNFPGNKNKPEFRACRLTTFVRKGMALNKILHELGHSVGMYHEHERTDVPKGDPMVASCFNDVKYFAKSIGPGSNAIFVTPYDRDSVMHYEVNHKTDPQNVPASSRCNLGNDNGTTGLSYFDQLTIRIMYPADNRVAEYRGVTVVGAGEEIRLRNEWGALGALAAQVVKSPTWVVSRDNVRIVEQKTPDFTYKIDAPGTYAVRYTFNDARGRSFANSFTIRVLPPDRLRALKSGLIAASPILF